MTRWPIWIALLVSLGVNLGILATLGVERMRHVPPVPEFEADEPPPFGRLADHLQLDGAARERFLKGQHEFYEQTRTHRHRLAGLRRDLRREVMSNRPDKERLDELATRVGEEHADLERALVRNVLDARKNFSPAQRRIYLRFLAQMRLRGARPSPPEIGSESRGPRGRARPPRNRRPPG